MIQGFLKTSLTWSSDFRVLWELARSHSATSQHLHRAYAHTGSRTRVTSMGGLYDAATLCAPVMIHGSEAYSFFEALSSGLFTIIIAEGVPLSSLVLPSLPCSVTLGAPPGLALSLVPPRPAYALPAWIVELGRRPPSPSRPAGRLNAAGRPSRANPSLEHKHLA